MNTQILGTCRDMSGGYKVDVTRDERIGRVSSEWFSRPADERYLSLSELARSVDGDTVVFLIGMRINRLWKVWRWLPVLAAMPRMLRELTAHPELGLLHARPQFGLRNLWVIQYWQSTEHLHAYAQAAGQAHLPAWRAFNTKIGTGGDVGIWHETYVAPPGHAESVYVNMPRFGLGLAGSLFPAKGQRASAAKRLSAPRPPPQHRL